MYGFPRTPSARRVRVSTFTANGTTKSFLLPQPALAAYPVRVSTSSAAGPVVVAAGSYGYDRMFTSTPVIPTTITVDPLITTHASFPTSNMVDGVSATYWKSAARYGNPFTIVFDFGVPVDIACIKTLGVTPDYGSVGNHQWEGSLTGTGWTVLSANVVATAAAWNVWITNSPCTTTAYRYYRLNVTTLTDSQNFRTPGCAETVFYPALRPFNVISGIVFVTAPTSGTTVYVQYVSG